MGGGVPFCMLPDAPGCSRSPLPFLPPSCQIFRQTVQKGAKVNFYLMCFCVLSGFSETRRGKNEILFYFWGFRGAAFILFCGGGGGVHWVQVVGVQGLPVSCGVCVPSLYPYLSFLCCFCFPTIALKYAFVRVLRAFLAGFGRFVWVCVVLVRCVACVAFVRVWS